jgi:hypothetical protein
MRPCPAKGEGHEHVRDAAVQFDREHQTAAGARAVLRPLSWAMDTRSAPVGR